MFSLCRHFQLKRRLYLSAVPLAGQGAFKLALSSSSCFRRPHCVPLLWHLFLFSYDDVAIFPFPPLILLFPPCIIHCVIYLRLSYVEQCVMMDGLLHMVVDTL